MIKYGKYSKNNKKGYSLLEIMLVLGTIAVLIAGAFYIYEKVKLNYEAEEIVKGLGVIASNYKDVSSTQGTVNSSYKNNELLNDYLNGNYFRKGGTQNNSSMTIYTLGGNTISITSTYSDVYTKVSLTINKDLCSRIAYNILSQGQYTVSIGSKYFAAPNTYLGSDTSSYNSNYSLSDINDACSIYDSIGFAFIFLTVYR